MTLLLNFQTYHDTWWYKELEKALKSIEEEESKPLTVSQNPGLRRPSAPALNIEEDDLFMDEVNELQGDTLPSIAELDGITIWNLKYAMLKANIRIEHKLLRPFLVESFHILSASPEMTDEGAIIMVKAVLETCRRMFSAAKVVPVLAIQREGKELLTLRSKVKEIKGYGMDFDANIRALSGDTAVQKAIQSLWTQRSDLLGLEQAKKVFVEGIHWLLAAQKMESQSYEGVFNELLEVLDLIKFEE